MRALVEAPPARAAVFLAVALSIFAALGPPWSRGFCLASGTPYYDDWYSDMSGHWAEDYVRVLWEEEVADGHIRVIKRKRGGKTVEDVSWLFKPDEAATRAQIAMLLTKALDIEPAAPETPSFTDVPPHYEAYDRKPGYAYVETAVSAGLMKPLKTKRFVPDGTIQRQDMIVSLVQTLGLEEYAMKMPSSEATTLLKKYKDRKSIRQDCKRHVAAATKLRIVEGYEDGTVRPERVVSRAEMATLVYRSCLVRTCADPQSFSPDGDGFEDVCRFEIAALKNRNLSRWTLEIAPYSGHVLKSFSQKNPQGHQFTLTWDGTSNSGERLGPGPYYYRATVRDRHGQTFTSVWKPVDIEIRSLHVLLSPGLVRPGRYVEISAMTTGRASRVIALPEGMPTLWLTPVRDPSASDNDWNGRIRVPAGFGPGAVAVEVIADFGPVQRTASLRFTVSADDSGQNAGEPSETGPPGSHALFCLTR